jgi:hypothetical protein
MRGRPKTTADLLAELQAQNIRWQERFKLIKDDPRWHAVYLMAQQWIKEYETRKTKEK